MKPNEEGWIQTRAIRNALSNYFTFFWVTGLSLFVTPIIVHSLGETLYGIWVLLLTIFGSLSYMELGVGLALIRKVVQDIAKGSLQELNHRINSVVTLYFILAAGGATVVSVLFPPFLQGWFKIGPEWVPLTRDVLFLSAIFFVIEFPIRTYLGILWGLHRIDLGNSITMVGYTLSQLLIVLFLRLHFGLRTVVLVSGALAILQNGIMLKYVRHLIPSYRFRFVLDLKEAGHLVRTGIHAFIGSLGSQLGMQLNRFLLGFFQGVHMLTFYELATKVSYGMFLLFSRFAMPLYPATAQFEAEGELQKIKGLFFKVTKLTIAGSLIIFFLLYGGAYPFMRAWMGEGFYQTAETLRILLFGYLALSITVIPDVIMYGIGKVHLISAEILCRLGLQILLGLFLIPWKGIEGAALALSLSTVGVGIPFFILKSKCLDIRPRELIWKIMFLPVLVGILALLFFLLLKTDSLSSAILGSLLILTVGLGGFYIGIQDIRFYLGAFKKSFK